MPATKSLHFSVTAQSANDGEAAITISTAGTDRHRDKVMPGGGNFQNFLKNPVVLFGHDYHALPVGTATAIESTADGVKASWKWLQNDPMADRVKNAWDQGVLRAASIGFAPTKWAYDEERRGYDYLEWDLLEFSLVAVPANAEAVRTLKEIGLPVDESMALLADVKEAIAALPAQIAQALQPAVVFNQATTTTADNPSVTLTVTETSSTADSGALAITLAEDDPAFFSLDDDTDDVNLADLPDALRAALGDVVRASVDKALLYARGRID